LKQATRKTKSLVPIYNPPPVDLSDLLKSILESPLVHKPETQATFGVNDPRTFDEFVGQKPIKHVLKIIVDAAIKENRNIPNILLTGGFGHGKTTLSKLIVDRFKRSAIIIDGSYAESLLTPNDDAVYIVDEIHNMQPAISDSLNILLDSGKLHLIGCTTSPGKLQAPFRSRFRHLYINDYTENEIGEIVTNAAKRTNLNISEQVAITIAKRSKFNPRNALLILDFVREIVSVENLKTVTQETVEKALDWLQIDKRGLTDLDRKYLETLKYLNPIGLKYISSILCLDTSTIEEQIEPFLVNSGFVERTPRGRMLIDREIYLENL